MTPAPADRPCGCDQSVALTAALAAANAELAALRSRLDPGSVEAVERVAAIMGGDGWDDCPDERASWEDLARLVLAALSGGG